MPDFPPPPAPKPARPPGVKSPVLSLRRKSPAELSEASKEARARIQDIVSGTRLPFGQESVHITATQSNELETALRDLEARL